MICINAEHLSDGLYNVKNGKIYKYKAKGGTVRTYELRNIVTCGECKYRLKTNFIREPYLLCKKWSDIDNARTVKPDDFCSYGQKERASDD